MKIYVASNIRHAPMWRKLRARGEPIISSWLDWTGVASPRLWDLCTSEPADADVTITYAEETDTPKGTLIECGVALGAGKHVIQVGSCPNFRSSRLTDASFTMYRNWHRAKSIKAALKLARELVP